jgi:hypothetical protein
VYSTGILWARWLAVTTVVPKTKNLTKRAVRYFRKKSDGPEQGTRRSSRRNVSMPVTVEERHLFPWPPRVTYKIHAAFGVAWGHICCACAGSRPAGPYAQRQQRRCSLAAYQPSDQSHFNSVRRAPLPAVVSPPYGAACLHQRRPNWPHSASC